MENSYTHRCPRCGELWECGNSHDDLEESHCYECGDGVCIMVHTFPIKNVKRKLSSGWRFEVEDVHSVFHK